MNTKATFLFLLCIGTLLAGCAETPAAQKGVGLPGQAQFGSTTGAIRGLVLDEDQLPIADARVGLTSGGDQVGFSGPDGVFVISFVPPGDYALAATADGYLPAELAVTVAAGEITDEVLVTLTLLPSDTPYTLTATYRRTVSGATYKLTPDCIYLAQAPGGEALRPTPAWSFMNSTKTCGGGNSLGAFESCNAENPCSWNFNDTLNNNTEWRTILIEGEWIPTSATTGRSFYIDLAAPGYRSGNYIFTDPEVWYDMANQPPVSIRADRPDQLIERGLPEERWCCRWIARLFPAQCDLGNCFERQGLDIGLMIEQTIDLYHTLAIHQPLPDGYSARPID